MANTTRNLTRAGQVVILVIGLISDGFAQVLFSPQEQTTYQPLRYGEDWSYLSDQTKRSEDLDRLKYIPLGTSDEPGWYLSLGGEARVRYEYFSEFNFGAGPQDDNGYL